VFRVDALARRALSAQASGPGTTSIIGSVVIGIVAIVRVGGCLIMIIAIIIVISVLIVIIIRHA